jgi:hypothetical protein
MAKHLNESEIAQMVEFLMGTTFEQPSDEIKKHVQTCKECKVEIFEMYEFYTGKNGGTEPLKFD